jgi:hypothetical protein
MPDFHNLDTPIFAKTYDLYKLFYSYIPSFPKKDRYALGQKCEIILLNMIEEIIVAGSVAKKAKLQVLKKVSIKVDFLKVLFRLGKDLKVIDNKKYLILQEYLQEIGKMIGGWIRSISSVKY